jgi:aspartate/glutamate racemase
MEWNGVITSESQLSNTFDQTGRYISGHPIGIIAVDLGYPKLPGNVANATTFKFPVLYKKVTFEIEQLFEGQEELEAIVVNAAKELEAEGVRAIVGACGYFAHFQKQVANAVNVPVFLSSLCQLPLIKLGLKDGQKVAVLAASASNIDNHILSGVGASTQDIIVADVGSLESFAAIRWSKGGLDNERLTNDLCAIVKDECEKHPEIGAVLLECSDLPPYAYAIQRATGKPVYDFITLINWVYTVVVQKPYFGYF